MNSLDNLEDDSAPYTDGLLNDDADTYFDPDIKYIDNVRDRIFIDGLKEYANRLGHSIGHIMIQNLSIVLNLQMIIRRYNEGSSHY